MTDHNLFQEVQEDLERQRLEALWKKYSVWVLVAAVLVVAVTAGATAYRSWQAERDQRLTTALLEAGKADPAGSKNIPSLQKFADENQGTDQAAFALLKAGALAAQQNDKAKAAQIFDSVASDSKSNSALRQLGDLLSVQVQLDGGDPVTLAMRLQPLAAEHAPWRFSAMEMQGYLALRTGDKAKAKQIFTDLSQDAAAPQTIAARATDLARSLN